MAALRRKLPKTGGMGMKSQVLIHIDVNRGSPNAMYLQSLVYHATIMSYGHTKYALVHHMIIHDG